MTMVDLIQKKRRKEILSKEELTFIIEGYLNESIPDYQMSAFLMAVTIEGMTEEETFAFTELMLQSGDTINLSKIEGNVVDKHSTGGVGDKTTLILGPLVASCGVKVAKMSGRGLGHTGGTIDKLEAIPGFRTNLSFDEFINQVNDIGFALVGSMGNLVPADKKIYALRDVTGTVASIPLIASSIMSKKLASGADKIVIDVKVGNGALCQTIEEAEELAHLMKKIGEQHQKEVVCFLTNMTEPLGNAIGNALEVQESIDTLKGHGPEDLTNLVVQIASTMVMLGLGCSKEEAEQKVSEHLSDGSAYRKFETFVERQGGNLNNLSISHTVISLKSPKTGIINAIDTYQLGELSRAIGAGRLNMKDEIDYTVGLVLNKKIGDFCLEGEELLKIYLNQKDANIEKFSQCFTIEEDMKEFPPLILNVI